MLSFEHYFIPLIFDRVVDREGPTQSHALFTIDKQCVHLLLQVVLELRFGLEQLLVLGFRFLQLAVQRRYRVLDVANFLHQTKVGVVTGIRIKSNEDGHFFYFQ